LKAGELSSEQTPFIVENGDAIYVLIFLTAIFLLRESLLFDARAMLSNWAIVMTALLQHCEESQCRVVGSTI